MEGNFEIDFVHSVFRFLFYRAVKQETMSLLVDVFTITDVFSELSAMLAVEWSAVLKFSFA